MDYAFTSSDITALGISDETTVNLLLKTTIKGSYSSPVPMYYIYSLPWFMRYGGVELKYSDTKYAYHSCDSSAYRNRIALESSKLRITTTENGTYELYTGKYHYYSNGSVSSNTGVLVVSDYADVQTISVYGKCNIFGIEYDGWKTLTYNGNTVTIEVYDDTGATTTINGTEVKGVKKIKYNGNKVKTLNCNGTVYDLTGEYLILADGTILPKPPDIQNPYGDNQNHWWVRKNLTNRTYDLVYSSYGFGYYDNAIYCKSSTGGALSTSKSQKYYTLSLTFDDTTDCWSYNKETTGNFGLDDNRTVVAASEDIYVYSSTSTKTTTKYFTV